MLKSRRLGSIKQLKLAETDKPPLIKGDKGDGVAAVQNLLADIGYKLPKTLAKGKADGIYGVETEAAVREFQRKSHLSVDGIVGTHTLRALDLIIQQHPFLESISEHSIRSQDAVDSTRPFYYKSRSSW